MGWASCRNADVELTQLTHGKNNVAGITFFHCLSVKQECRAENRTQAYPQANQRITNLTTATSYWAYKASFWATTHPTELHSFFLSYAAPSWAMLHPTKLRYIILSYAAPYWSRLLTYDIIIVTKLCCTLLTLPPSDLRCTIQRPSYLFWPSLHLTELRCTLSELRCTLLS